MWAHGVVFISGCFDMRKLLFDVLKTGDQNRGLKMLKCHKNKKVKGCEKDSYIPQVSWYSAEKPGVRCENGEK